MSICVSKCSSLLGSLGVCHMNRLLHGSLRSLCASRAPRTSATRTRDLARISLHPHVKLQTRRQIAHHLDTSQAPCSCEASRRHGAFCLVHFPSFERERAENAKERGEEETKNTNWITQISFSLRRWFNQLDGIQVLEQCW